MSFAMKRTWHAVTGHRWTQTKWVSSQFGWVCGCGKAGRTVQWAEDSNRYRFQP